MGLSETDVAKQIQQMIAFIQQEAAEKVEEIEAKAEEEFNIEKSRLVAQQRTKIIDYYEKKEKQIELQRQIQQSNLSNASRLSILKARDDYIDNLKEEAKKQLSALSQDPNKYKKILSNLISQGLFILDEDQVTIRCRRMDIDLVKKILPESIDKYKTQFNKNLSVKIDENEFIADDSAGGVELFSMAGKIKVSNTIEARLTMIFNQILPEIREKLFGANKNRKHRD